jgi:hypothetical protein
MIVWLASYPRSVVEKLDAQVKALARTCKERLPVIQLLDAEVKRRADPGAG